MVGKKLLYLLLLLATLSVFAVCACCCGAVLKFLSLTEDFQMPHVGLLLFPELFFFAAELYILQTSFSVLPSYISLGEAGKHSALLVMQILGLVALLCTLYAYKQICRGFHAQAALQSLEQATQAQKNYIAEAQIRYEQTKAFRHDIANHFSVLNGLFFLNVLLNISLHPENISEEDVSSESTRTIVDNILKGNPASDNPEAVLQEIFSILAVLPSVELGLIDTHNLTPSGDGTAAP